MPRLLLGLLATVAGIASCSAEVTDNQDAKTPLDADFAKYVNDMLEKWHTAGIAIGIVDGDSVFTEVSVFGTLKHDLKPIATLSFVRAANAMKLTLCRDTEMQFFPTQRPRQIPSGTLVQQPRLSWQRHSLSLLPTSLIQLLKLAGRRLFLPSSTMISLCRTIGRQLILLWRTL